MRFATGYRRRRLAVFARPGSIPTRLAMVAVVLLVAVAAGGTSSTTTAAAIPAPKRVDCTNRTAGVAYPLRVRGRHLVDARGRPFLINGDSAWSLIAQLRDDDVDRYLDDRKARGFNAVLVSLIEHTYASKAPADIYGTQPFRVDDDFTTPNEAYLRACGLGNTESGCPRDCSFYSTPPTSGTRETGGTTPSRRTARSGWSSTAAMSGTATPVAGTSFG